MEIVILYHIRGLPFHSKMNRGDCVTFGEKLRLARREQNLTQRELAARINAKHNSISNWENDQNMPDPDTIQHLCWALDVQPNYFFSIESPQYPVNMIPSLKLKKVPLLGTIVHADTIATPPQPLGEVELPAQIEADFALVCQGDSMVNARIFDGDIVFIRRQETVEDGQLAAVVLDGEASLKRLQLFSDHIVLESENPMYRPLAFWDEERERVRVLGRAVAFTGRL